MSNKNGSADSEQAIATEALFSGRRDEGADSGSSRRRLKGILILLLVAPVAFALAQTPAPKDYSKFTHQSHLGFVKVPGTLLTRELRCDSCHDRAASGSTLVENTPRNQKLGLSFPGHRACVGCHVTEFTAQPLATCTICHASEKGLTARPPQRDFPLRYDFNAFFDAKQHEAHIGYKYPDGKRLDCATCHQPTAKKAARLIPSHQECYVCHTPASRDERAREKSGCVSCHTHLVDSVKQRDYRSLAYGVRFSHDTHVQYVSGDCTACHTISGSYNRPASKPGTIRIQGHVKERERTGKGCFSCHDGGSHLGRTVFTGEFTTSGQGACIKCHGDGDEIKVFPASG